ncbi:MAG: DUF3604 domain-containing protein [Porticoccaceae bacterium]|nr:DUF3604 domain-containing protein [Porticoccaceae bacterium]MBT5577793.1 DUF3604 domain-containing protein [Porticoccaceae bacterium]MBT7375417.1 DUF3604 domain-containing protein [Porticoccaceae bacterium]
MRKISPISRRCNSRSAYYVRAVQNPSCRWSTYDSLRLGKRPRTDVPALTTEMAWGSPIWVKARVE